MTLEAAVGARRADRPGFLLDLVTGAETDLASVQRLAEGAAVSLAGAGGVALDAAATLTRAGNPPVTAGSATRAYNIASSEDRYSDGPMAQAAASAAPVQVTGVSGSQRWEPYRRRLTDAGYGVALAVPLELDARSSCALVFLGPAGFDFTPDLVGEAAWFAGVAAQSMKLAIEVRSVRSAGDNLKAVLESRTSIDVACGVIMAQNRCSYTEAFGKLAGVSRQRNLKVRSVAENVLKALPNGSPVLRFEPPALA
ncbi:ANTAR domain-containing protein [Pseudarthrobacter enclensis]|uniref:ANTAR domain-containing protein n=1 Tax=Pseudarthrobacter enclensis TaxID=993070 RepID=UPI003EE16E30